jgi:6-pyruvoyl-tetrahydropterin synthase
MTSIINKDRPLKLFVRDLTVIDASYLCPKRGMVGESWILDVEMSGSLNEMSMVLDFGRVKKQIKQLVDQFVDHRLLVPMHDVDVMVTLNPETNYAFLDMNTQRGSLHLHAPDEALCLIDAEDISIASVTTYLHRLLLDYLPSNVTGLKLTLRHEALAGAFYHYSHGLKKHDGNCQRIAHGHRSPIEILVDGVRQPQEEALWATRWADIYLAAKEDMCFVDTLNLSDKAVVSDETHFGFAYDAPQGHFELAIAKSHVEIIETDTTVELLAEFIASTLKPKFLNQTLEVVAYEGVAKGAIASL